MRGGFVLALAAAAAVAFLAAPAAGIARPSAGLNILTFRTPSGNIVCAYYQRWLRCDIRRGLRPRPSRPARCPRDSDFGQGLELGPRRAEVVCAGDTVLGEKGPALRYGRTWSRGAVACWSRITGLTCKNALGHGFFMSRQSWRLF